MEVEMNPPGAPPPQTDPASQQLQPAPAPPVAIRRRAPIACRRCRRMRSKCLHDKSKPPCRACLDAGLGPADCVFPVRGQPDHDREYRHPRVRADKSKKRDTAKTCRETRDGPGQPRTALPASPALIKGTDDWDLLPPLPEIIEAVNKFTSSYFQLGFIPKQLFPERLRTQHRTVSVFFLLSLLSISARLTPALVRRYGSAVRASETFMERAAAVAQHELYKDPSLERCQSFYLLSIAQQGSGMKHRSSINMAVAMRMATLMQLHREETYILHNPTKELIIRAESARRTLVHAVLGTNKVGSRKHEADCDDQWMLHSQDNLHSGPRSPVLLAASDITALLPCNERDFAEAREPTSRAALEDTPPAVQNPALVSDGRRSLFAVLIQAHYYWGVISRRAISNDKSSQPWEPTSEFAVMAKRLADWEASLPKDCRWSSVLVRSYKQEGEDLAYVGATMITRLCNIVIRKAYLHEMISYDKSDPKLTDFWAKMAHELFRNVYALYEQTETHYAERSPEDGPGAQMAAFCVYSCGFLACYLCKFPSLCPDLSITSSAPMMVQRMLSILAESQTIWPLASRWYDHLEKFYSSQNVLAIETEGGMDDSREPIPHVLHPVSNRPAVKPSQPRILTAPLDDKTGIPTASPVMSMASLHRQQPPPASSALYHDPSLRTPVSQPEAAPPPPLAPQQAIPPIQAQATPPPPPPPPPQAPGPRQTTDGLGLLLEAFDTHQTAAGAVASAPNAPPPPPQPQPPRQPQPVTAYDPHTSAQQYYAPPPPPPPPAAALAVNDGYENELGYYMSDGVPPTLQQSWAGSGDVYGY